MTLQRNKQIVGLVVWLGVCFIAAAVGGMATTSAGSFYSELVRPSWAPPASLFGPVWTVLYALMGISAWLVWRRRGFQAEQGALTLFLVQLVVNALWSWLFFAWHLGAVAFVEILLLCCLVLATLLQFWRRERIAGALLVPYLLWISFAAALNFSLWRMNSQVLG